MSSRLRVSRRVARRLGLTRRLGRSGWRRIAAGGSRRIVLRIDRADRRRLRQIDRRVRATVITTIRTADGARRIRDRVVLRG